MHLTSSRFEQFVMKALKLLIAFFVLKEIYCESYSKVDSVASYAINSILSKYFSEKSPKVDLIYFGKRESLVTKILRNKNDSTAIKVSKSAEESPFKIRLNISSILLFDSAQTFRRQTIVWQTDKTVRHRHLVHIPNSDVDDLWHIKDGFLIDKVNFLLNGTGKSINLVSSFMFTPKQCRSNQYALINRFNVSTMKWSTPLFYQEKYRNLYGCKLFILTNNTNGKNSEPADVIDSFAKDSNFKTAYFLGRKQNFAVNVSNYDLLADPATWSIEYKGDLVRSYPYFIDRWTFFIPPGELYTPFEKMFLPFQFEVWIGILVTLLIGFVAIQIINFTSIRVQSFVYGHNIQAPTVNLAATFLCGVQTKVPGRNFARFLLMNFIIWCLIIRTCYQSELFKYLQSDLRKPEPRTVVEMIKKNFTFYDSGFLMEHINRTALENGLEK